VTETSLPTYIELMHPTLLALDSMGGEGKNKDIEPRVDELAKLSRQQLDAVYSTGQMKGKSIVAHRQAFARTWLQMLEAIESVDRAQWRLTPLGLELAKASDGPETIRLREHELRYGKRPDPGIFADMLAAAGNGRPQSLSVRNLLAHWGLQRRGQDVIFRVERDLANAGLVARPSISGGSIDSQVSIEVLPVPIETTSGFEGTSANMIEARGGALETAGVIESPVVTDSLLMISHIPSASRLPESVSPTDTLLLAQSKMMARRFSQLPVMQNDRTIKGVVSWESIAKARLRNAGVELVKDAMDADAIVVDDDSPVLRHADAIAKAGYVFVRDGSRKIVGIVTTADMSDQFVRRTRPFLVIGEIEVLLRRLVDQTLSPEEIYEYRNPSAPKKIVLSAGDLTFGSYVKIFENAQEWERFGLTADREIFRGFLDKVRLTRNEIMHFNPDPLTSEKSQDLEDFYEWLKDLLGP
jgi:predicted transcriptional regulator